jgi:hypothetical protein
MSQEDGKSDFFSLDPPLTLSPPKSTPAKKAEPETVVTPQLAPQPAPVPAPVQPVPQPVPQPVVSQPVPQAAPAPAVTQAPPAPAPVLDDADATPVDDEDDVIIVDDDGDDNAAPVGTPPPQAAAPTQQAAAPATPPPAPAPAEPPAPPTFEELNAMTSHADLADAMAQVSASPVAAPTASSVLRQSRPQRPPSALKKNVVPLLFTIGSILFIMGGWAIMAKMGIINRLPDDPSPELVSSRNLKIMIGLIALPVGLLLLGAAIFWGIQVYSHKPEVKPKR